MRSICKESDADFTKNSSRMKYLALATSGSSFGSNTAAKTSAEIISSCTSYTPLNTISSYKMKIWERDQDLPSGGIWYRLYSGK